MDDAVLRPRQARKKDPTGRDDSDLASIHNDALLVHLFGRCRLDPQDAKWEAKASLPGPGCRVDRHDCYMGVARNLADIGDISDMLFRPGPERVFEIRKLAPDELPYLERQFHQ